MYIRHALGMILAIKNKYKYFEEMTIFPLPCHIETYWGICVHVYNFLEEVGYHMNRMLLTALKKRLYGVWEKAHTQKNILVFLLWLFVQYYQSHRTKATLWWWKTFYWDYCVFLHIPVFSKTYTVHTHCIRFAASCVSYRHPDLKGTYLPLADTSL